MITPEQINDAVQSVEFHNFRGTTQTACCLTLQNGYSVIGLSDACHTDVFDIKWAQRDAREDADKKVGALLAFVQRELQGLAP